MKKTIMSAMATLAILLGGATSAFAQAPCEPNNECTPAPCYNECTTPACQAQQGYETIGEGTKQAAVGSYNTVKEGAVNTYNKAVNGVENGYETVKEGTVNTYNKAKNGVEGLWNKTKEAIHEATD